MRNSMNKTYIGRVTRVLIERGFFFVTYGERELFCHVRSWSELDFPKVGEAVSFEVIPSRNSRFQFEASNARPIVAAAQNVQEGANTLAEPPTTEGR
jgi:hypothetical protein